ncbi:hypothetical protein [Nonomuraea diastatica]|uniref:Uncharacterized protein n=1 Tax=Nonomuraea diastatica TaxID=1848329 RepID=A0A4R4WPK1_9ACTN|nr:hypothetical protein [Nonomuraea diastatica]TDD20107.1 hypothetical protein E1294_18855 [Nonomuraea diastatica]
MAVVPARRTIVISRPRHGRKFDREKTETWEATRTMAQKIGARTSRLFVVLSMILALVAAAAATASPALAQQSTEYTCSGQVCIRLVPDGTVAPMDAHGCSVKTCVTLTGNASKYFITGSGHGFFGHVHIWGPGVNRYSEIDFDPSIRTVGKGAGKACAEGWDLANAPTGPSVGLACKDVR